MTSFDPEHFTAPTLLHSKTFLPDNIWIARPNFLQALREQEERKDKRTTFSISDINDSDFYSIDEVTTTGALSDDQTIQAKKPPLPPRKHAKQKKANKQRKPHFQEESDSIPTPNNETEKPPRHIQAVRAAIEKLGDDPNYVKTYQGEPSSQCQGKKTGKASQSADVFEANEDSFSLDLTNFVRKASIRTKNVLKKFQSSEMIPSSRKFWRRNKTEVTEGVSSGSLSTANPSASYHLPQDMSPVSNRSGGVSSEGDLDIPFSNRLEEGRTGDNFSRGAERGDGNRELEKKTYSALRYVQKWKSRSKKGGLMPRSKTRNEGQELDIDENAMNSSSREESLRRRLARSLSF